MPAEQFTQAPILPSLDQDRLANLPTPKHREYAQQLQDRIAALKGGAELKDLSVCRHIRPAVFCREK